MQEPGYTLGKKALDQVAKTVREVSRRMMNQQPTRARWKGNRKAGTTTTPGSSTICPCGTTYARGSITDCSYGGEHANEYQFSVTFRAWGITTAFTIAHSSGCIWDGDAEEIFTCYGGSHDVIATLTVCEGTTICGVAVPQAKLNLATDTNTCDDAEDCDEDDDPCPTDDIDINLVCDHWNPLGTSAFRPVGQEAIALLGDCVVCVSPVMSPICNTTLSVDAMYYSGTPSGVHPCQAPATLTFYYEPANHLWRSETWACTGICDDDIQAIITCVDGGDGFDIQIGSCCPGDTEIDAVWSVINLIENGTTAATGERSFEAHSFLTEPYADPWELSW